MTNPTIRMAPSRVDLEDLVAQSARAMSMMDQVRGLMLSPSKDKVAPDYSASAVATLCGIEKSHLNYRLSKEIFRRAPRRKARIVDRFRLRRRGRG